MESFLIGYHLWRVVIGQVFNFVKQIDENEDKYLARLDELKVKIIKSLPISIVHPFLPYISSLSNLRLLKKFEIFLAKRHTITSLAHQYQIWSSIHNLKQQVRQLVNDFLAQIQLLWSQLAQVKVNEDQMCLIQFFMAFNSNFKHVWASLLHKDPFPTFKSVVEFIFEETRLALTKTHSLYVVLTTSSNAPTNSCAPQSHSDNKVCKYCHNIGHILSECSTIECHYCH